MNIQSLLINEAIDKIEHLKDMEVDSDQYKAGVDSVVKIVDRLIEMDKFEDERTTRFREYELQRTQAADEKIHHIISDCLTVIGILVPAGVTIWGALKSWEFEREGVVTSAIGRLFINKLGPKK